MRRDTREYKSVKEMTIDEKNEVYSMAEEFRSYVPSQISSLVLLIDMEARSLRPFPS